MNTPRNVLRLAGEEVAAALTSLGIDPDAERITTLQLQIDARTLQPGDRAIAVRHAVELASRASSAAMAGEDRSATDAAPGSVPAKFAGARREEGFALAARRFKVDDLGLLSFHATRAEAVAAMTSSLDTRNLSVMPAVVHFAANGNVRQWDTAGEPVAAREAGSRAEAENVDGSLTPTTEPVDLRSAVPGHEAFGQLDASSGFGEGECSMKTADGRYVLSAHIWAREPDSADDSRRAVCDLEINVTDEHRIEERRISIDAYEFHGDGYGAHLAGLAADGTLLSMWRESGKDVLLEADPRPVLPLDPDRPLYDEAGREYPVVASSGKQVVTNTNGTFGVWDRKTGECLIANCEGVRLSNERPAADWIARRRTAVIDVLSGMHAEAAIERARSTGTPDVAM